MRKVEYLEHVVMISQLGVDWIANVFSADITRTKPLKRIVGSGEHAVETEARHFIESLIKTREKRAP